MEGAPAKAGKGSPGGGDGKSAGARAQDAKVAGYLEELKPKVLAAFEKDNVGTLPRPELAVRIGQRLGHAAQDDRPAGLRRPR